MCSIEPNVERPIQKKMQAKYAGKKTDKEISDMCVDWKLYSTLLCCGLPRTLLCFRIASMLAHLVHTLATSWCTWLVPL